ncbi:hypothetical protein AB0P21_37015 [Kribbella sp. NPDC056861]|uniref:hypothetical protein n=1 Tax=Kribbella sp. NPDC056861 TaxID=3154857 RepID=UPI00343D30A1
MPELFQQFGGMADSASAMTNMSSQRQLSAEDHLRASQTLHENAWMDGAGVDAVSAIHQEVNGTLNAAEHQQRQGTAWNQCAADGQSTLATCRGIAAGM